MGRPLDTERALLEQARRGDTTAYEALVRAHQHVAFRTAFVFCRTAADAEDAAQEAFLKAWRSLPRFRPGAPFRPWLLAIVANEARSRARAAGRRAGREARAAALEPPGAELGPSPEAAVLVRERRDALAHALAALPERDRTVLTLRFVLGLSESEAAAALGCRRGTVKSRSSRALERLRELVEVRP